MMPGTYVLFGAGAERVHLDDVGQVQVIRDPIQTYGYKRHFK